MKKISVNMLSIANIVKGQGVESAYNELIELLNKYGKKSLNVYINKGLDYDVIHMHTVNPTSYIKQRLASGNTLTYVHFLPNSLEGTLKIPSLFMDVYSWWVKKCYMKSDYLVVVNPTYIKEMIKMGYDKKRIFYIPNVVSNENFFVMDNKDQIRKKYNYKKNDFIVIGVGQLHKAKGVIDFINIAKQNPDIKFIWVGGFNFGKFMEGYNEIKKAFDKPPKNLMFTGLIERKEVNILLNMSDVFFLPSYYESFGLVTLEASMTEKPIILRDLDVYKEIFNNKYLKGKNNEDFIKNIRNLKDNKKLYDKYVNKSKSIKKMYNEKAIYKKWINLYKIIAKNKYLK